MASIVSSGGLVLAQAAPPAQGSILSYIVNAFGVYGPILMLVSLILFAGASWAVRRHTRVEALVSYAVFLPVPVVLSLLGVLKLNIASLMVLTNANVTPKFSEFADGLCVSMILLFGGLLAMVPAYAVLGLGWLALTASERRRDGIG